MFGSPIASTLSDAQFRAQFCAGVKGEGRTFIPCGNNTTVVGSWPELVYNHPPNLKHANKDGI